MSDSTTARSASENASPRAVARTVDQLLALHALPPDLADLIRDVVSRSRLWGSEKLDVAGELIAHFLDGLETGADSAALLQAFGDPRQAARLIRRAKKRSRPWLWRAMRRTLQFVGCIALGITLTVGFFVGRMFVGRPTVSVDYVAEVNRNALGHDPAETAWPRLRKVLMTLRPEFQTAPPFTAEAGGEPGASGWDQTRTWLNSRQEEIAEIRAAAALPHFGFVASSRLSPEDAALWPEVVENHSQLPDSALWQESTFGVLLPYLGDMRQAARMLGADVWRAAEAGDGAGVVANVEAMLRFNRHLRELPVLINDLVGMAIVSLAQDRTIWVLQNHPDALSREQLQHLAHAFAAVDDALLTARPENERFSFYDAVQRMYTDNGSGDGHMTWSGIALFSTYLSLTNSPSPAEDAITAFGVPLLTMDRKDIVNEYDRCMNIMAARARTPLWQQEPGRSIDNDIAMWAASDWMRARLLPIVLLLPAVERAGVTGQQTMLKRDVALVALALEAWRRDHGGYPAAIAELTPRYLPSVPLDPFDGQPLRYRRDGDKPLLYSIGTDRDDDGGRPHVTDTGLIDQGPAMRWSPQSDSMTMTPSGPQPWAAHHDGDWILYPPLKDLVPAGPVSHFAAP